MSRVELTEASELFIKCSKLSWEIAQNAGRLSDITLQLELDREALTPDERVTLRSIGDGLVRENNKKRAELNKLTDRLLS